MNGNRFNARRGKYNVAAKEDRQFLGRTWDSKAEMLYAQELMLRMKAGDILDFAIQPLVILAGDIRYRPDFLVTEPEDIYYVDVKGVETERFKIIKKLWPQTKGLRLEIVKRKGSGWDHVSVNGYFGAKG